MANLCRIHWKEFLLWSSFWLNGIIMTYDTNGAQSVYIVGILLVLNACAIITMFISIINDKKLKTLLIDLIINSNKKIQKMLFGLFFVSFMFSIFIKESNPLISKLLLTGCIGFVSLLLIEGFHKKILKK